MKKNLFAKASEKLEARLTRVQNKLESLTASIEKVDLELASATGVKKTSLMTSRANLMDKFNKEAKKYAALTASKHATGFLDDLFSSFKNKWIPIVATVLLVMGPFSNLTSFLIGTVVNAAILFGVLCVIMHAKKKKYVENPELVEKPTDMIVAKVLFLAVTLLKLVMSFFGPTVMMVVVIIAAIGIALYIERKDLKILFERLREKNDGKGDDDGEENH